MILYQNIKLKQVLETKTKLNYVVGLYKIA